MSTKRSTLSPDAETIREGRVSMNDGDEAARARVARAVRELGEALMTKEVSDGELDEFTTLLRDAMTRLRRAPQRVRDIEAMTRQMFPDEVPDQSPVVHFDDCLISGRHNPFGIGMRTHRDGSDGVRAKVTLAAPFEGAPGRAHGGVVAALLDDIIGYLLTIRGTPGFTGQLDIRYLAPTPVGTSIDLEAHIVHEDGRRTHAKADARADGVVVATATAMLISVEPGRFAH